MRLSLRDSNDARTVPSCLVCRSRNLHNNNNRRHLQYCQLFLLRRPRIQYSESEFNIWIHIYQRHNRSSLQCLKTKENFSRPSKFAQGVPDIRRRSFGCTEIQTLLPCGNDDGIPVLLLYSLLTGWIASLIFPRLNMEPSSRGSCGQLRCEGIVTQIRNSPFGSCKFLGFITLPHKDEITHV